MHKGKLTNINPPRITTEPFYPDILVQACELYKPVLVYFGQLLKVSPSSEMLLKEITKLTQTWMRIQLLRVFRKYVSPDTSVEMLKSKNKIPMVCVTFGKDFRPINVVQKKFNERPLPDEALCAYFGNIEIEDKKDIH